MSVFRIEKNKNYTVMSNYHLKDKRISLKAKGLLSQMLSLPEDWDYTLKGLSLINRESIDAIRTAVWELEKAGYITRQQNRDDKGKMAEMIYTIYEQPQPELENPTSDNSTSENPTKLNTNRSNTKYIKYPPTHHSKVYLHNGVDKNVDNLSKEKIMQQLDYSSLVLDYGQGQMDEIVNLIDEIIHSTKKSVKIDGNSVNVDVVVDRFRRLNAEHIKYIFGWLKENRPRVRNSRKYMLSMLFNAPVSMETQYTADFYYHEGG